MWIATLDIKDEAVKGGFRRAEVARSTSREHADALLVQQARLHARDHGHTLKPAQTFPGATWIYCSCGAAFHSAQGR